MGGEATPRVQLTPEGRERLRQAALRNRPWERSTGPISAAGKAASRMNAWKHGRYSAEAKARRRAALRFIRAVERGLARGQQTPAPR